MYIFNFILYILIILCISYLNVLIPLNTWKILFNWTKKNVTHLRVTGPLRKHSYNPHLGYMAFNVLISF